MVEEPGGDVGAHDPEGGRVDGRGGDRPGRQRRLDQRRGVVDRPVQLLVQAGVERRRGRVDGVEVRHDVPVEAEVTLEHVVEQRVLAGVRAVDLVVGAHHPGRVALSERDLEGQVVDLPEGPLVHVRGAGRPVGLLLVGDVVLEDRPDPPVGLDAADAGRGEGAAEQRVLAEVFGGAPGERGASAGHAGAEDDVAPLAVRLVGLVPSFPLGEIDVPGGGLGDGGGEGGDPGGAADAVRAVGVDDGRRAGHLDRIGHAAERGLVRVVGGLLVEPAQFLVQGAGLEQQPGALVGGLVGVHPGAAGRDAGRGGDGGGDRERECRQQGGSEIPPREGSGQLRPPTGILNDSFEASK